MRHQALSLYRTVFYLFHDPDFIVILVHILGVFRMVGSLAFYPAEVRHIDHVVRCAVRATLVGLLSERAEKAQSA